MAGEGAAGWSDVTTAGVSVAAEVYLRLDDFVLDAALSADAGEVVAITGPNGSGKTTLLRAIAGLVALQSGRITLGETTVDDPAAGVYLPPERRGVGYAFQDLRLLPHLSALANVEFGLRLRGVRRLQRREARAEAVAALEAVGMAKKAEARPSALSGGEAQRVAVARALAPRPPLLLLDEAFSAVEAESRPLLRQLVVSSGATVLVVSHDPETLEFADRAVALQHGEVATDLRLR